jgi:glycosyltransferase involved in cell wall biosynthesis
MTVAMGANLKNEFRSLSNVEFLEIETSAARRFWFEQTELPQVIRQKAADVLLCTGNFALRKSPVPQILLSRNSIYTSADYYLDLRSRHEYGLWFETKTRGWLARKSIQWADVTVAPSEAFAAELRRWTGVSVRAIHHGFDQQEFTSDSNPLSAEIQSKLRGVEGAIKLLFVSHYNYYRNFETLLRALPFIRDGVAGRSVKLLLTCRLREGENPGDYHPAGAARLIQELGISDMVIELGTVPYSQLHHVYGSADLYVTPAYTETFAHPLVEAMCSGLPVIASDLPVHREICGDAARYFSRFSSKELAGCIIEVSSSPEIKKQMSASGRTRALTFSWRRHVDELLSLARSLVETRSG